MSDQEDRFDFSDGKNHENQGGRYRKSSEYKNNDGKADSLNWGDKILSMIQESAESMDFAELSHNIQKTIDVAREETMKQVDKAKEEAAKQIDRAKEEAARQVDKAKEEAAKQIDKAKGYQSSQAYVNVGHGRKVIAGKLKKNPGLYSGPAEIAVGAAGLGAFGGAGIGLGTGAFLGAIAFPIGAAITSAAVMIPFTLVSAFLLGKGILSSKRARRIRKYASIWTGKPYVMIEDLERKVGWDRKKILKDIHFLTERELIIGAELDAGETCLMLTDESKQQYASAMDAKRQREQEEAKAREAEEALKAAPFEQREIHRIKKDGQEYLEQLAELKKEIVSDEMRRKVEQMETLTARIFVCASEHPESISQTDRLFKYYFPSVLKLLKVYEDVEKQPIQGENIKKTKKEIEDSLDTMNQALEKLFDEMFQNVAMDISSDIQVLEVMLKQDGLTEDGIHADQKEPMLKL
nr:5-bromo-4-chloroindolyl phosphate hydrolysis family protein [uncultured Anaerobutyricum sp.]